MLVRLFLGFIFFSNLVACAQANKQQQSNNSKDMETNYAGKLDTAFFAGGCFWCTEAIFQRLKGVVKVTSGYIGGNVADPTYEEVCDKTTGHAEAVQILFDPQIISFDELLEVFFKTHDPTTLNRQGNDAGTQYRSVVFYTNLVQKEKTEYYIKQLNIEKVYPNPIVTFVVAASPFYTAESYHQNYYNNNSSQGYCRYVIQPKLEKFEKIFKDKLKTN